MWKFLSLVALSLTTALPAHAAVIGKPIVVTAGDPLSIEPDAAGNVVATIPVTDGEHPLMIKITGCEIGWNTGDQFILLSVDGTYVASTTALFAEAIVDPDPDGLLTLRALASAKHLCVVIGATPLKES